MKWRRDFQSICFEGFYGVFIKESFRIFNMLINIDRDN